MTRRHAARPNLPLHLMLLLYRSSRHRSLVWRNGLSHVSLSHPAAVYTSASPDCINSRRRAKAERESRRKAIQERARKGLPISDEEQAILAEDGGKDDCTIM